MPERVNPRGEAITLGVPKERVRVTLGGSHHPDSWEAQCKRKGNPGGGRRSSASPLVEKEQPTPHLRVGSRVKNALSPPPLTLAAPTRTITPRSAGSTGTRSACRLPGWK